MKTHLFLILVIYLSIMTSEKELDWKMITLCATGVSQIIMEKIPEEKICFRIGSIIPECPAGTDEIIRRRTPILKTRACYKKCREGGIKIGTICYYCDEGYIFLNKEKKCQNINYRMIIKSAIREKAEEVPVSHCMKNTTVKGDYSSCEFDCSVLGLKEFDDFCAIDEDVYKKHLAETEKRFVNLIPKWVMDKLKDIIFDPPEIDWKQFDIMKKEYLEYLKTDKIYTTKYQIMATLKSRIKVMDRDIFAKLATDWAVNKADDYGDYLENVCPKVASYLYDNSIKEYTKDITLKETFAHYANLAFDMFLSFYKIDKIKNIWDECFRDVDNLNGFSCLEKVYDLIGEFDPTFLSSIFSTTLTYYKQDCNIEVNPENSEEVLYWYHYYLDVLYGRDS